MAEDVFPSVLGVGDEERTSPAYVFNNRGRGLARHVVVQRTRRGGGWFEDAGGRRLVQPGQAMLFTHDEPSSYGYPPEATETYALRFVGMSIGCLSEVFVKLRADFGSIVNMPDGSEATGLLDELCERFARRTFRDRLHEADLIHRLLIALYREQVSGTRTSDPIEYGHHYLHDHFRSSLNLKELAQQCGVSREHFIRAFRRRYGEPPGEVLRRLRLEQARRMLRATHVPVQEVALACGFADANTFCRAYRLRYGTTPGSVRKR